MGDRHQLARDIAAMQAIYDQYQHPEFRRLALLNERESAWLKRIRLDAIMAAGFTREEAIAFMLKN